MGINILVILREIKKKEMVLYNIMMEIDMKENLRMELEKDLGNIIMKMEIYMKVTLRME